MMGRRDRDRAKLLFAFTHKLSDCSLEAGPRRSRRDQQSTVQADLGAAAHHSDAAYQAFLPSANPITSASGGNPSAKAMGVTTRSAAWRAGSCCM